MNPIPEFPGYFATEAGNIISVSGGKHRTLRQGANRGSKGYMSLRLRRCDGRTVTVRTHQLVAAAFIGPRPIGMVTCHCDGNKLNNRASNLRYDTQQGNNNDRFSHGTILVGTGHPRHKLSESQVREIRSSGETDRAIADRLGVSQSTISRARSGALWKCVDAGHVRQARHKLRDARGRFV